MSHNTRYTAAVVQHPPVFLDLQATLDQVAALTAEAAGQGARLVAFSESHLPGFPLWVHGIAVPEHPAGMRLYRQLLENAVEIPSPALARLQEIAARHKVVLVIGATELDARYSRGTVYNSLIAIGDDGALLGVHRKLMPTHAERIVWGCGDASGLRVHDTSVGRLGGLICWEHWMPLTRFALHASGEQVHVAVWPDVVEVNHLAARHYAFEGSAYVLCVGQLLRMADLPDDEQLLDAVRLGFGDLGREDVILPGGAGIIGPDGSWIAGPAGDEPTIVYGEIDLASIPERKSLLDTGGHYNRPDIFSLTVDRRPRRPVAFEDEPPDQNSDGTASRGPEHPDAPADIRGSRQG